LPHVVGQLQYYIYVRVMWMKDKQTTYRIALDDNVVGPVREVEETLVPGVSNS
jgi:hypothetical protein